MGYNEFTAWLSDYMERNHLTQEALAAQLGVRHPTIGDWLRGKHPPTPASLRKLAEVSGENPIVLFRMVEYLPEDVSEVQPEMRPAVARIMRMLAPLDDLILELIATQITQVLLPFWQRLKDNEKTSIRVQDRHPTKHTSDH